MKAQENLLHGCRISNALIMSLLIIEYIAVFYKITCSVQGVLLLIGYACLSLLFTCNSHGRKVRVRYEQELSLMLKDLTVNVIMIFFLYATIITQGDYSITKIVVRLLLLSILQIASIWILCAVGKRYTYRKKHGVRLYIWEDKQPDISGIEGAESISVDVWNDALIKEKITKCDEVYLYDISAVKRNDLLKICFAGQKPVYFTTKLSDMELRIAGLAQDGDTPLFYCDAYRMGRKQAWLKRMFDIIFAFIFLIVLSPLFGIIALIIKAEDGGSIFYRQIRCTKDQRQFTILKFRSMVPQAEDEKGARLADSKDERCTKIGHILRKFKLDELPQLINILKGDMSFVGPRPERPELIEETLRQVPEFILRTKVPAGLTGYAQVHGDYHTNFLEKLKWDLMYIENYSLLLDFKIILMTIPTVLRRSRDI